MGSRLCQTSWLRQFLLTVSRKKCVSAIELLFYVLKKIFVTLSALICEVRVVAFCFCSCFGIASGHTE